MSAIALERLHKRNTATALTNETYLDNDLEREKTLFFNEEETEKYSAWVWLRLSKTVSEIIKIEEVELT